MTLARLTLAVLLSLGLASCSSDGYESGDGKYSYLTANFCLAHTSASKTVDYVLADDGSKLVLSPQMNLDWAEKADTLYRALLYYNKNKSDSGNEAVEPVAAAQVPVLRPVSALLVEKMFTDPLSVESCWLSENRRYVNLTLLLKTGKPDTDDRTQTVGLVIDSIATSANGVSTAMTRLYHNQGGVPEYYTVRRYVSIDTRSVKANGITITANTYNGLVEKHVSFSH